MKKILITTFAALVAINSYSQNTFPENGNVGIGTVTPESGFKLDVNGLGTVGTSGSARIYMGTTDANNAFIQSRNLSINRGLNFSASEYNFGIGNATFSGLLTGTSATFSGKLGIGTTNPDVALQVYTNPQKGEIRVGGGNGAGNGRIFIQADFANNQSYIDAYGDNSYKKLLIDASPLILNSSSNGNVGIGTASPFARLHIKTDANTGTLAIGNDTYPGLITSSATTGEFRIDNRSSFIGYISFFPNGQSTTVGSEAMRIDKNGSVGIGTTDPKSYKLAVAGKIHATEVQIEVLPWPDYVFHSSYKLPDLKDTEQFIKENKHLPEIPSAAEVKKEGIKLGEMNAKLLQKIEELTLYMIEQNKKSTELSNALDAQNKLVKLQNERLVKLEAQINK